VSFIPSVVALSVGSAVMAALLIHDAIERYASSRCFDSWSHVPNCTAAVVLGCSNRAASGSVNLHYLYRIDAAAELWHRGVVRWLLVSGDNGRVDYDEPTQMKADLVLRGVPAEAIYRDYAGFRTLDTVVRARDVFGLERFIIISQPDHIRRAVYLACSHGIDAIGYAAQAVDLRYGLKTRIREWFARARAVLDVEILAAQPRFRGERVPIGVVAAN